MHCESADGETCYDDAIDASAIGSGVLTTLEEDLDLRADSLYIDIDLIILIIIFLFHVHNSSSRQLTAI